MLIEDKIKPVTGKLTLTAYDQNGAVLWHDMGKNLIVTNAYTTILEALGGMSSRYINRIAVGDNPTEPAVNDTAIANAVNVAIQSVEYPSPDTVRFNFTIGYNDAIGMSIREFGLITAAGTLFSRKVRAAIEKTPHMTISGKWDISI